MIKLINRLFSKILATIYLFSKFPFLKLFRSYDKKSKNVVWIKTSPIKNILSYLKYNDLLTDMSIINGLLNNNQQFKIAFGKQIGKETGKVIFYGISETVNPYRFANYSKSLYVNLKLLESQGNKLFPDVQSVLFWENKDFMHEKFKEFEINHPDTIIHKLESSEIPLISYPVLIKEIHSAGSKGLHLVKNQSDFYEILNKIKMKGHNSLLIQKLINMRKDLRVVIRGNDITSYYWRINPDKEWKPTATSFGGYTEFDNFPKKWENKIIEYTQKLGLLSCAYDITWENDDIDTEPIILEVSPHYQLNPKLPERYTGIPYKKWKQKLLIRNAYHSEYVDQVLENYSELIKIYIGIEKK